MDSRNIQQQNRLERGSVTAASATAASSASNSDPVLQSICNWVHQDDLRSILTSQNKVLKHFERTNEMLVQFNKVSASRLAQHASELRSHSTTLLELKRDLETVFKRIRNVKKTLRSRYGDGFCPDLNEDELDEQLDREYFDEQVAARTAQARAHATAMISGSFSGAASGELSDRKQPVRLQKSVDQISDTHEAPGVKASKSEHESVNSVALKTESVVLPANS